MPSPSLSMKIQIMGGKVCLKVKVTRSNSGYLLTSSLQATTGQSNGKKSNVLSLNLVASALRMAGLCISRVGWATLYFCHHPTALYILCHPPSFGLSYQSMNEHDIFRDICDKNRYLHYIYMICRTIFRLPNKMQTEKHFDKYNVG